MKSRMERYYNDSNDLERSNKNQELYDEIYNSNPSSNVAVLNDNESEIDITKVKELIENREGYRRVKEYQSIIKTPVDEEEQDEKYDIYEDIDNKVYDINAILENAKSKREETEREPYRSLKNTQYNILSNLNLNGTEEKEPEEMVTDFFTQDKEVSDLITSVSDELKKETLEETNSNTSADLFEDLKGSEDTILTEPVKNEDAITPKTSNEDTTFYTNHLNFTQQDFEEFQDLQSTVKTNNRLIKVLITILSIILVGVIAFLTFTML